MTRLCQLCGEFESEEITLHPSADVCFGCLTDLIDNEVERRGMAEEKRKFDAYWGDKGSNREAQDIQDLKDAGRGHLT